MNALEHLRMLYEAIVRLDKERYGTLKYSVLFSGAASQPLGVPRGRQRQGHGHGLKMGK
jgi:hypothetical protein